jgi:hypothetical protein
VVLLQPTKLASLHYINSRSIRGVIWWNQQVKYDEKVIFRINCTLIEKLFLDTIGNIDLLDIINQYVYLRKFVENYKNNYFLNGCLEIICLMLSDNIINEYNKRLK